MNKIKNDLWPEDIKLLANMEGNYVSDNEKAFFERTREGYCAFLLSKRKVLKETLHPSNPPLAGEAQPHLLGARTLRYPQR